MSKKNKKTTKPEEEVAVKAPVEELENNVEERTVTEVNEDLVPEGTEEYEIPEGTEEDKIPEVKDEEEIVNEFTSPENIENLEKEMNESYNVNNKVEENEYNTEEVIDLGVAQEAIERIGDANQRLNDIVNNTKPEDLQETLQEELNQATSIEDKLKQRIDELEKKIPQKTRSNLNSRMTNLWCGVRYT